MTDQQNRNTYVSVVLTVILIGFTLFLVAAAAAKRQRGIDAAITIQHINQDAAEYRKSLQMLCKQYRSWQALPGINGQVTGMDDICARVETP